LELERLLCWIERQAGHVRALGPAAVAALGPAAVAALARRRDYSCSVCGYGLVSREPPARCPLCCRETTWKSKESAAAENGNRSVG
jgi:rubrerythrin